MSLFAPLYQLWAGLFYKAEENNKDPYKAVLFSSVARSMLHTRYKEFTEDGIPTIESLTEDKREFFWGIAINVSQPGTNNDTRIKTAKAAYALSLIVSKD